MTVDLDEATAGTLVRLSQRWGIPLAEAVTRAVEAAEQADAIPAGPSSLSIFRQLQSEMNLSTHDADAWKQSISDARR